MVIAGTAPFIIPVDQYFIVKALIITFATLIPVIYTLKGHLKTIFRLPKYSDIITIIIGVVCYVILAILVSYLLTALGIPNIEKKALSPDIAITVLSIIIQLLGEELEKFIIFSIVIVYSFKCINRKNLVILAIICSQLLFALIHLPAYGWNLIEVLLSIGVVFSILPLIYIKTKNITVTYLTHLFIDIIPILISTYIVALL